VKQKTKGILAFAFLGGILLTSTVLFAIAPPTPTMTQEEKQVLDRFDLMIDACADHTSGLDNQEEALIACQEDVTRERNFSLCDIGQRIGDEILIDEYCIEIVGTTTGTPMDNFPDDQRATFCGSKVYILCERISNSNLMYSTACNQSCSRWKCLVC
jgi:hypothetical protein